MDKKDRKKKKKNKRKHTLPRLSKRIDVIVRIGVIYVDRIPSPFYRFFFILESGYMYVCMHTYMCVCIGIHMYECNY